MATTAETAVRSYLIALNDPTALRDDAQLADLQRRLAESTDTITRLELRQKIMETEEPQLERYEADFVTHAKEWADHNGISPKAFLAEGVDVSTLRRAGFSVPGARGRPASTGRTRTTTRTRSRVTTAEVRSAIPKGTFTIKHLQERSGASPAVVRKAVQEEIVEGRVKEMGTDPDHRGPGRAPVLYERV
ncbi:MAG: hypothetical protein ACRDTT_03135 [Pseudonocardiaceae bacterium]